MHETKVNTENADVTSSAAKNVLSPLEQDYSLFGDSDIERAASGTRGLLKSLNRMHQVAAGVGVVLRIVAGNSVLEDEFDPALPGATPPLSRSSVGMLTAMAATLCEEMRDQMEKGAYAYRDEVKA